MGGAEYYYYDDEEGAAAAAAAGRTIYRGESPILSRRCDFFELMNYNLLGQIWVKLTDDEQEEECCTRSGY